MKKHTLNNNKTDYITSVLSSALGMVPYAGDFLSEIVKQVIPDQRTDRIVKFVEDIALELKEQKCDIDELKQKFNNNYKYGAYLTGCFRYITNEIYEEKINYYKKICISGITDNEKNLIHCERILKILSELDFYEIQYLRYYYDLKMASTKMMEDAIEKIGFDELKPIYDMGMDESQIIDETYKQITLNNLEKNGLIEIKINMRTSKPHYEITTLGRMILKKIGYDDIIVY